MVTAPSWPPASTARLASTAPARAGAAPTFGTRSEEDIMAHRLFRTVVFVMLTIALLAPSPSRAEDPSELRPTFVFTSTRDFPTATTLPQLGAAFEIYLM